MKIYPVSDGDIFDLGDRKLEVLDCGGHTPGHIVLINDLTRICFAGDVCNGNTLLEFDDCLPVSVYRENLKRLKTYASRFDMMYGTNEGGMRFNMSYDPANITGGDRTHQIIKA